jgi:hypothetical protein
LLRRIEANANKAEVAVFLVQEFSSARLSSVKLQKNRADWATLVRAFPERTNAQEEKNQILGPISVPGGGRVRDYIPLYLGSMCPQPRQQRDGAQSCPDDSAVSLKRTGRAQGRI